MCTRFPTPVATAKRWRSCRASYARYPRDGELLFARASIWFDWGRIREACTGFLQAEAAGLARIALYLNLAWSWQLLGDADEAEPYARKAIALDPDNVARISGWARFCSA